MLSFKNKTESVNWSNNLLKYSPFYIVDTETSGNADFKRGIYPEPISVAIVKGTLDGFGVVYNQLIKPHGEIDPGAIAVHGITPDKLTDKPTFKDVYADVVKLLHKEVAVAYNAAFDFPVLDKACTIYSLPCIKPQSVSCAMLAYSAYHGERHPKYNNYIWHKLVSACKAHGIDTDNAHDASADSVMTYKLIHIMSKG